MRQLKEQDRARIIEYCMVEPEFNIFIIGDIENFGVQCEEVGVYVNECDGAWDSLVLRYMSDYVVYSHNKEFDAAEVASFLKARHVGMISGKTELIARLVIYFPERTLRSMFMTKCAGVKSDFAAPDDITVKRLTSEDAENAADLMMQIEEFRQSYEDRESSVIKIRTNLSCGGTGCGAYLDGALVSCAQTGAGNSVSAMVVGVATQPDMRGRGYASAVVSRLCSDAFLTGKRFLCLFYDNPQAGRIYNRIGFEPFGEYALFR